MTRHQAERLWPDKKQKISEAYHDAADDTHYARQGSEPDPVPVRGEEQT